MQHKEVKNSIQKVRTLLKSENIWKKYVDKFPHRQMKLLFSKIALIIIPKFPVDELVASEKELLASDISPLMFVPVFQKLSKHKSSFQDCDWVSFGKFCFYAYQTSTYWADFTNGKSNIFNQGNFVGENSMKRKLFSAWLESIDKKLPYANSVVRKVLKQVF